MAHNLSTPVRGAKRSSVHLGGRTGLCVALWLSFSSAGCASFALSPGAEEGFLKAHYVLAHEDGFAISVEREFVRRKKLSSTEARADIEQRLFRQGIDIYARRLWPSLKQNETASGDPLQILVFVHGGVNGYGDSFKRMRQMLAKPEDCSHKDKGSPKKLFVSSACDKARSRYYPIFVAWNADFLESIVDDLFSIRFGKRLPELGWFTWPFVVAGRVAESVFSAPNDVVSNFGNFCCFDAEPDLGDALIWGPTLPAHSLSTPVVKVFGAPAWQIMKRRANLILAPTLKGGREGAGWSLLRALAGRITGDRWWNTPTPDGGWGKVPVEFTLVAHSMGTIVGNQLLAAVAHLGSGSRVPLRRIVYLAPAASIEEVEAVVRPFLHTDQTARFLTFNLNEQDEFRERHWSQMLPWGTVLVWVDYFFVPVVQPGDRRYGRFTAIDDYYRKPLRVEAEREGSERFLVCKWKATTKGRPRKHHHVDDPQHLERILLQVERAEPLESGKAAECYVPPGPR